MTREEALKILKSWDGYMFLEREGMMICAYAQSLLGCQIDN